MNTEHTNTARALLAENHSAKETRRISLDELTTGKQVREYFNPERLADLAASLKSEGQLQPILVFLDKERQKYVVLAGERRLRAARLAGLDGLDCIVYPTRLSPMETAIVQITENTLREHLDPIEEATGFKAVMDSEHLNQKQAAARLHVAESTIARALVLLDLPADIQAEIRGGGLVAGIARELGRLPAEAQRREVLALVRRDELTAAETNKLVSKLLKAKKKPSRKAKPAKTSHRLGGGFEAVLTPKRITLSLLPSKKSRTHEDTIAALESLIQKIREEAAKAGASA